MKEGWTIPTYDYQCNNGECSQFEMPFEVFRQMKDESEELCPECKMPATKMVSAPYNIRVKDGTLANQKEEDHLKRVKDRDRAERMRKKAFGSDAIGTGDKPENYRQGKEINVKGNIRGRAIGGQMKEIDKQEFIKAAAKDDYTVAKAQEALKKSERKKK